MAVYIPLTRGGVAVVDDEDAALVSQHKWQLWERGPYRYAMTHVRKNGKNTGLSMHRLIMGEPAGQLIDHIDGDGLNNRRSTNLRVATRRQNRANSFKRRAASSSYKGVYKFGGSWRAQIAAVGLPTNPWYIGSFDTAHDAAQAYDAVARILFGAHARLNYPRAGEAA